MKFITFIFIFILTCGCSSTTEIKTYTEPEKGILINEIPPEADIIFSSSRHVLNELDCLDENYDIKENFIVDKTCNEKIYTQKNDGTGTFRQLFALDIESGLVIQITNTEIFYLSGHAVDANTLIVCAVDRDTNNDGNLSDSDYPELYLLHLDTKEMKCLTDIHELKAINNPDYSIITEKVVFSAQRKDLFHNYLFTIDKEKNLVQLTFEDDMDFDCSWSDDGTKIVFSRLPKQAYPWTIPSQIWMIDSDGSDQIKLTNGSENINNEKQHGEFPIGMDVDPAISHDNMKVVFSRLKTGLDNSPFGIYQLISIDIHTGKEEVISSSFANMLPDWSEKGIIFIRQIGSENETDKNKLDPMQIYQGLYLYYNEKLIELEKYPYNIFPIGAYSCSFISKLR